MKRIDPEELVAFDVHVHIEHTEETTATDSASAKYFGDSGAARDRASIAEYYRSRRMACVVFSVDERLTDVDARSEASGNLQAVAMAMYALSAQRHQGGAFRVSQDFRNRPADRCGFGARHAVQNHFRV